MLPIVGVIELGEASRPIGGYGLCVALGMVVAGGLTARATYRIRGDVGAVIAAIGYTIAGGVIGAWLTFLAVEWARTGSPMEALRAGGGLVFYGAVPGGLLASYFGARALGVPWAKTLDLAVPALAAGHAIGRVGCLLGGCCFGAAWEGPWSVTYTHPMAPAAHPSLPRHPTPIYEAGGLLLLAFVFSLTPMRRIGDGARALSYVCAYALLRLTVELSRGDGIRGVFFGVSTSQWISIALLLGAAAGLYRLRGRPQAPAAELSP